MGFPSTIAGDKIRQELWLLLDMNRMENKVGFIKQAFWSLYFVSADGYKITIVWLHLYVIMLIDVWHASE